MKDLFYYDKNRSAIFRKYKIYVDVSNVNEDFDSSQKLNSFFGQIGVYEGHDKIIKVLNTLVKSNNTNFYFFDENEDFESSLETEEFSDEEANISTDKISNAIYSAKFEQFEILKEFFQIESSEEHLNNDYNEEYQNLKENIHEIDSSDDFNNIKSVYYVPLFIFFFFGEKRINFLTLFSYRKKFYFEIQKIINCLNFVSYKEKEFYLFKTFNQFSIMKSYIYLINIFKKIFKKNSIYYKLLNLNNIDFFKSDNFLWPWYKQISEAFKRQDKRKFVFKNIVNKKYFQIYLNVKRMKWVNSFYLFNISMYKGFWYINKFKHQNILTIQTSSFSQLYSIKKKILKKFKRRKRYKKKITRSFFGLKYIYHKVFNIVEEKKKKKRK